MFKIAIACCKCATKIECDSKSIHESQSKTHRQRTHPHSQVTVSRKTNKNRINCSNHEFHGLIYNTYMCRPVQRFLSIEHMNTERFYRFNCGASQLNCNTQCRCYWRDLEFVYQLILIEFELLKIMRRHTEDSSPSLFQPILCSSNKFRWNL